MEQQHQTREKKIGISAGELITAAIVIISALLLFWMNTNVRLNALELRMNSNDKSTEQINTKLDRLQEGINDVKVKLTEKQDRKQ